METLYNAKRDFLTSCYMRELIKPYLEKLFAENKALDKEFSIILLDVDHFKTFNDKNGHLYGDEVLKYFSSSIRLGLANIDSPVFRYGGDEFIIVLPGKSAKEAYKIAVELQNTLNSRPFLQNGKLLNMSFSGGVASCATDGESPEVLIKSADSAMYVSKKRGRARTTVYSRIMLDRMRAMAASLVVVAVVGFSIFSLSPRISSTFPFIKFTNPFQRGGIFSAEKGFVTVYLNSGTVIEGKILRENRDEIEVRLDLEKGKGSLTIKRSNIKSIKRY